MKSLFGGSALAAAALLSAFLLVAAKPSVAETAVSAPQTTQSSKILQNPVSTSAPVEALAKVVPETPEGKTVFPPKSGEIPAAVPYVATAYSLRGRTASGKLVSQGIIAADPGSYPWAPEFIYRLVPGAASIS